jgi:hypothetical protein
VPKTGQVKEIWLLFSSITPLLWSFATSSKYSALSGKCYKSRKAGVQEGRSPSFLCLSSSTLKGEGEIKISAEGGEYLSVELKASEF